MNKFLKEIKLSPVILDEIRYQNLTKIGQHYFHTRFFFKISTRQVTNLIDVSLRHTVDPSPCTFFFVQKKIIIYLQLYISKSLVLPTNEIVLPIYLTFGKTEHPIFTQTRLVIVFFTPRLFFVKVQTSNRQTVKKGSVFSPTHPDHVTNLTEQ